MAVKKALRILAAIAAPVPILAGVVLANSATAAGPNVVPLRTIPHNVNPAVAGSTRMGDRAANDTMSFAVSLKLHDEAGLHQFLNQVSDHTSPLYHHYLTPAQFTAKYGPTKQDVATVTNF